MKPTRVVLDTAFVQALLNSNDQYHRIAKSRLNELRTAQEVWTTEAILIEIGTAPPLPDCRRHRTDAGRFQQSRPDR